MNSVRNVAAAALLAASASGAGAQAKCEIKEDNPGELRAVRLAVIQSDAAASGANVTPIVNAIKQLNENAAKIDAKNAVGRQWALGRLYYNLARILPAGTVVTRGQVGLDNPAANVDPLAGAMDALAAVDRVPGCTEQTAAYRQNMFALAYAAAVRAYQADDMTGAQASIERARALNEKSPDLYNVAAAIAQKRNDTKGMIEAYRKVIEYAGTDTAYNEIRETATQNIGILTLQAAETASADDKRRMLTEARDLFAKQLAGNKCDLAAFTGFSRSAMALGDTAAVKQGYKTLATSPDCKFTDMQLFDAGANAAILDQNDVARTLLARGLAQNPYYRDALYNLANIYWTAEQADSLTTVATRLVQVDPDNPDNWRMLAAAQQIRMKAEKDPARKKAHTDSLVKLAELFTKMPVKVSFTEFRHSGEQHVLAGTVENRVPEADAPPARPAAGARGAQRGAAPAAARASCPKPDASYTLNFEFLDSQGNVVDKASTTVGPIACGETKPFRVTVNRTGIAAFRYASVR